MAYGFIAVDSE